MTDSSRNEDALFDRLADGELSPAERRELLASLDERADGWRRCALALLESQAWREDMAMFLSPPQPVTAMPVRSDIKRVVGPADRRRRARSGQWMALAACLAVAFTLGWLFSIPGSVDDSSLQVATSDSAESPLEEAIPAELLAENESADVVTLVVRDVDGRNQRVRLPLVEASALKKQWGDLPAAVPEEVRAGLAERGFDIHSRRRFAPLFFEQNRQLVPMVVPVEDAMVVPVNRPVY